VRGCIRKRNQRRACDYAAVQRRTTRHVLTREKSHPIRGRERKKDSISVNNRKATKKKKNQKRSLGGVKEQEVVVPRKLRTFKSKISQKREGGGLGPHCDRRKTST